jgi:anthraniloyl-CoA monooxygenase
VKRIFADEPDVESWKARGSWQPCRTVTTGSWHSKRMLLLGRAAYSAHPSVGLDVRQGLEDAECLADLLLRGEPVEAALEQFVKTRKPVASSLQRAASASESWLAHAANQAERLPFDQFALACLTRSLRITHTHVKGWAPDLVARVDRLVARVGSNETAPPPMFAPLTLRGLTLANRIVVSPMCMYSAVEGTVNDFHLVHLGSRAQGGAGLVFTEMTDISPEGRISLNCAGMYAPEHVPAWKRVVDFVHRHSEAKIGVQLAHAGRKAALTPAFDGHKPLAGEAWDMLAPSPIPFAEGRQVPREMDQADLDRIRDAFATGARMADQVGFDMIELHMAHGYLLSSFISPLSNRRSDRYGGPLANRMRFPLEVFGAVRAAWPQAKPISVRISAVDWVEGGTTIEEAVEIARLLREAGNDVLDVSTGAVTNHRRPTVGRLYQTGFADHIRNSLGIPTMTVGGVASWSDANSIIAAGRADLCLMARGALIDPYFVRHAAHAQGYAIAWPAQYIRAAELEMHEG